MEDVEVGLTMGGKQKELKVYRSKRRKEPEVSLNNNSGPVIETSLENKIPELESSFARPDNGRLDVVLALRCPELSEKPTVKRSKKVPQSLKDKVDKNMVEAGPQKADEHKKVGAVQSKGKRSRNVVMEARTEKADEVKKVNVVHPKGKRSRNVMMEARTEKADEVKKVSSVHPKGKRTKNVDRNMVEARTEMADELKKVCAVESKEKRTKKLDLSDGNTLSEIPKQDVLVNKTVEATSETTVEHKEVCAGQLKGKRTARRKKLLNTLVNNNLVEKKWGSFGRITPISSVETGTVSEFNNEAGGNPLLKTQNPEVPVNTLHSTSCETEEHNQVGAVQIKGKRTKRGKKLQAKLADISDQKIVNKKRDNSDAPNAEIVSEPNLKMDVKTICEIQNQEVPVDRTLEDKEVCSVQKKRKRKRELKSRTDQGKTHPLENGKNKLSNTLDQNVVVGKSDSFGGDISTTLLKTASSVSNKVGSNQGFPVNETLEPALKKMEEHEEAGDVQLKSKKTKRGKKSQEASVHILDQSADRNIPTTSRSTESVSEFNDMMATNTSFEIQNKEVPVDRTLEDASKAKNEQDEVCVVQRKGKKKRGVKSRTDQGNKEPLEREGNKISSTLDQYEVVGKSDPFDGKFSTNSLKTASCVNLKVDNLNTSEVHNQPAEVSKSSKLVSLTSNKKKEACAAQQMSDAKGNTGADQNTGVSVCESLNVVSQDKQEVLCVSKKKRKKKKIKSADQENQHLSESASILESNIISIEKPKLESSVPEFSELAMSTETNKEVLLKDNLTAVQSRGLPDCANLSLTNTSKTRKKLLILDLNGLLVDIVSVLPKGFKPDRRISKKSLLVRPFCRDFLKFCFAKFNVGVWSSRTKKNVDTVINFIMADKKHELLFCWDQSHCTETGFNTVENDHKPLVFKELKKLWNKHVPNLPWEKGEYNESNTVLLDDSPYKALLNPPNTAIFPNSYDFRNLKDKALGPGGDLRMYLERLATAENIQIYIQQNPFGQRAVTSRNPSWNYYLNVISANKFCLPT